MKGFVFTLDALFSLLIAATGISILLYFTYTSPSPYFVQYASTSGLLNTLASTKLSQLSSIPLVAYIAGQAAASNQTWQMEIKNEYNQGGNSYGPAVFTIDYIINVSNPINNGTIVAGYGNVYFGARDYIYAINATTGNTLWFHSTPYNSNYALKAPAGTTPMVNATLLYKGMLIFATSAQITALNAYNGSTIWTTPVYYVSSPSSQPDYDEGNIKLYEYNGKLIFIMVDNSGPTSYLNSLYLNNGTYVGTEYPTSLVNTYGYPLYYFGISGGEFVVANSVAVDMQTPILNNTYAGGEIWSIDPACSSARPVGLSAYSNVIAYGCGDYAVEVSSAGQHIQSVSTGSAVEGVSATGGLAAYQSASAVTLLNANGELWSTTIPSTYGTALANSTPIISGQNIYTEWYLDSQREYLLMQNLSTGAIVSNTIIGLNPYSPGAGAVYSGKTNPYMALAYGRLFVSRGTHLFSYGTCPINPNVTVLEAVGTLYINGQGSCASYLLSKLLYTSNYTLQINNVPQQYAMDFPGVSNNIIYLPDPGLGQLKTFTISMWVNPNTQTMTSANGLYSNSGENSEQVYIASGYSISTQLTGISNLNTNPEMIMSPDNWYLITQTVYYNPSTKKTTQSIWVNGTNETYTTASGSVTPESTGMLIGSIFGSYEFFNGLITNVQIYNTNLNGPQIASIYRGGITASPVSFSSLEEWLPLQGNSNNYAGTYSPVYPFNVTLTPTSYSSSAMKNAFSITSQSVPVPLLNYSTGKYKLYDVGVYSWR